MALQPERLLAVDVGAGTTDILIAEEGRRPENSAKLVVPSRTQVVAEQIRAATERSARVVFRGPTMGGGPGSDAMRRHLAVGLEFLATEAAALTFADDLERVVGWGVRLIDEDEARACAREGTVEVRSGDLDAAALTQALRLLGAPTAFSGAAIAAQDHGFDPHGSNRVARFAMWEAAIHADCALLDLFYLQDRIPDRLTRLRAATTCLRELVQMGAPADAGKAMADAQGNTPTAPQIVAADTGPAALLGALPESAGDAVLVNAGNGHTVCVVARDGRLRGVYEHHTGCLDEQRLERQLRRFLAGELTSDEVREDGGHGAILREPPPRDLPMYVTGPNRHLLAGSGLPVSFPAPWGDMMMTGPVGLVRAFRALAGG